MRTEDVQAWIDRQHAVPVQRWVLRILAIAGAAGASTAIEVGSGHVTIVVIVIVAAFAALSAFVPDSHLATTTTAIVVWQWLAVVEDPIAWWSILVAIGLFALHAAVAMMAAIPEPARLPRSVLIGWLRRGALVGAGTVAVWGLIALLDAGDLQGSSLATAVAFVLLGATALALRPSR